MLSRTEIDRKDSQIEFISSHHPAFSPGDYTLRVSQSVEITAPEARRETYSGKPQMIRNQPPDTRLTPQQIRTLFPPEGSLGEYSQNLPEIQTDTQHTTLGKRMPYEQLAVVNSPGSP